MVRITLGGLKQQNKRIHAVIVIEKDLFIYTQKNN